jgi:glycosylphosphatidylinositol transamidase (GPIT) subunit GPI8
MRPCLSFILQPLLSFLLLCAHAGPTDGVEKFLSRSGHTNNWAVLVSTSRFWFNYRVPFHPRIITTGQDD